jgi:hypothetical protein
MRERLIPLLRWSVLPVLVGLLLAGLGPFGTFAQTFSARTLFWVPVVWLNWIVAEAIVRGVLSRLPERVPARVVAVPALSALILTPIAVGVVAGTAALVGMPIDDSLGQLAWKVLLVAFAIALPAYAWSVARSNRAAADMDRAIDRALEDAAAAGGGFERRWPAGLHGHLLFLEMEDHYLRIHTTEGSGVVLCRMEDAAHELADRGMRVHRSYWVAAGAVAGARRKGDAWRLRLTDGREIPVGRTYKAAVREAGWLTRG